MPAVVEIAVATRRPFLLFLDLALFLADSTRRFMFVQVTSTRALSIVIFFCSTQPTLALRAHRALEVTTMAQLQVLLEVRNCRKCRAVQIIMTPPSTAAHGEQSMWRRQR